MSTKIFIHGLESSNQGTKSIFFRKKFPDMILHTYKGDLQERMKKLKGDLAGKSDIRLVGSSFGGLMASLFAMAQEHRVAKIILLAPAINLIEFAPNRKQISVPVWIYHGRSDQVIPLAEVEPIAKEIFLDLSFHTVDDDHYLHKTFKTIDWDTLLA
jgi:pimeloyl-ACP methyl ester carboxylesterase